ncbi:hypothetical protein F4778DRAFT_748924 [Xylariomycetidae sp. FL2044]|nr:hypothetical protein F4778DRAFT_748924 [Xylariomycetidae sp. FL2044]
MSATASSPNGRDHELKQNTEASEDHTTSQKRKASSPPKDQDDSTNSPKRAKHDQDDDANDKHNGSVPEPNGSRPDRHARALQEEKKRGKRLFGGLLNTLSQTTSNSQQKRRQEIERRQQARVHQQRAEDDKHRQERLSKLRDVRRAEQLKFDERVMRTRHANMRATARFLQTRSRPRIYYLPWELTEDQEDIIKDQIHDVESVIQREHDDFKRRKEQKMKEMGIEPRSPTPEVKEPVGKYVVDNEPPTDNPLPDRSPSPAPSTANHHSAHTATTKAVDGQEKEADRADDVMIEGDEDTVIY